MPKPSSGCSRSARPATTTRRRRTLPDRHICVSINISRRGKSSRGSTRAAGWGKSCGDEAWKAIGQSAIALIDGAIDEAVNEGTRARDINGELGYASYQLGLVQLRRSDWDGAAQSFDRATQLMPEFA